MEKPEVTVKSVENEVSEEQEVSVAAPVAEVLRVEEHSARLKKDPFYKLRK